MSTPNIPRAVVELIADVIASVPLEDGARDVVAERFAARLAESVPRFDRARFVNHATMPALFAGDVTDS